MNELDPPKSSVGGWAGWAVGVVLAALLPRRAREWLLDRMLQSRQGGTWKNKVAEEVASTLSLCVQFGIPLQTAEEVIEEELAVPGRSTPQAIAAARRRLFLQDYGNS